MAQPTVKARPHLASRVLGLLLFLGALFLAFTGIDPTLGPSGPLDALKNLAGAATIPAVIVLTGIALLLLLRPSRSLGGRVLRLGAGAALVVWSIAGLLAAVNAGGIAGAVLWKALAGAIGLSALPILLGACLLGFLLMGVPPRTLFRGARRSVGALAAAGFWLVGSLIWLREKTTPQPPMATGQQPAMQRKPAKARPAPVPPPAEKQEATQPMLPVIHTHVDEPPRTPPRPEDWALPPISMLQLSEQVEVSEVDARQRAKVIENTLKSFGVDALVREINPGPTVTQFALEPGVGTKVARITSLQNDLALALAAPSIRIEAPVPGQSRVGLEIPNAQAASVLLRDVMDSGAFHNTKGKLKLALGRDVTGRAVVGDLARMPHLLIAGATGAGKSVCLNSIIAGLLFQHTPDELRFLMVDPKMVELKTFDGVPHLVWPVVTEMDKVVGVLKYAVGEMERRYKEFSELGIRNLDGYNRKLEAEGKPKLARMVVIIDELADLMMAAPEEVEASICRLAQMARAVGIHLILATQRPSVDVVTGLIKANFPSRIAFAVSSQIDSRVILDMPGAERLLGRGDMLFVGPDSVKPSRVQGTFVADEEIDAVVNHWKSMQPAEYDQEVGRMLDSETRKAENPDEDPLFKQALALAETHGRLSTSLLQRKLRIGYNRAARLMDALKASGELDTELGD